MILLTQTVPRCISSKRWRSPPNSACAPLVAHCHLGLGKLHGRAGKREQAREHLTTATTMYREMDMKYWLEQAAAETAALG